MPAQSLCDPPARDPLTFGPGPARALRLRWDLVAVARRVLAARDGTDPVAAASLLPPGVRPPPDALPVSDLTRHAVTFLREED
jgi:hypothetical protein